MEGEAELRVLSYTVEKKYLVLSLILGALLLLYLTQSGAYLLNKNNTGESPIRFEKNVNIEYTRHAKCRMECRDIDKNEIQQILQKGSINYEKVGVTSKGKTYPVEGITNSGQKIRVVVALHQAKIVIITVIDLEKEWFCNCN